MYLWREVFPVDRQRGQQVSRHEFVLPLVVSSKVVGHSSAEIVLTRWARAGTYATSETAGTQSNWTNGISCSNPVPGLLC